MFNVINFIMAVLTIGVLILLIVNVIKYQVNINDLEKRYQKEIEEQEEREKVKRNEILTREKKADEKKKQLHEGTAADNFDNSIDILHKYANRNH